MSLFSKKKKSLGFSLIELIVTMSIFLIIITVVIVRFISFDNTTLLKTLAYDMALSVRKAQAYSLGVFRSEETAGFRTPYGVSFTPDSTSYQFFVYIANDGNRPHYDTDTDIAKLVDTYALGRSFVISDVCIVVGGSEDCDIDRLDISFKRPEYTALFYADGYAGDQSAIESALIKVVSNTDPTTVGVINIGYVGQITVTLEN